MVDFNNVNYGLFAIPALYALGFVPHIYATSLLKATSEMVKRVSDGKIKEGKLYYNMPNPRSFENPARYSKLLDQRTFQRWERARATHTNILENAPFFVSAVLAAIITKLPARDVNIAAAAYLASRIVYMFSYIRVEKGILASARTFWFFVGIGFLAKLWIQAGLKIAAGDW